MTIAFPNLNIEETKSPNDEKHYRLLTLPNGLEVLLMQNITPSTDDEEMDESENEDDDEEESEEEEESDEEDEESDEEDEEGEPMRAPRKAGACLTVGVGSFAEPPELGGLAHYLEHMLFMGSQKYPDENEFEDFLSAHGGYSNGETDVERTSYMFEVGPKHLEIALDMFAQFFVAPLMKADAMERELLAIESEFSRASQDDMIRYEQVLCTTAKPNHPYHRFNWGNTKSLKTIPESQKIDVRAAILDFYNTYYSANIMKLVVCGEEELDVLENYVRNSFTGIANKNVTPISYKNLELPLQGGSLVSIKPLKDAHILHLHWALPPLVGYHRFKPAEYVAAILGHESEGSILYHLKQKGWASSVSAGVTETHGYDYGTFGCIFTIEIKLTLQGLAEFEQIVLVVFQFLNMMAQSPLPSWIFEEHKIMSQVSFRFQEEHDVIEQCEELAAFMQDMFEIPAEDLLSYEVLKGDFDASIIQSLVLNHLNVTNLRIHIASSSYLPGDKWSEEPWFGVQYKQEALPVKLLHLWEAPGLNSALHYQNVNPFIPQNLELVEIPEAFNDPRELYRSDKVVLFYAPDSEFMTPRAFIMLHFDLPAIAKSPDAVVISDLYLRMVKDSLNAYAYQAQEAQLSYVLHVKEGSGFEFHIGGFSDKLMELVNVITKTLATFTLNNALLEKSRFNVIKEELVRSYKNVLHKPQAKAKYLRLQLIEKSTVPLASLISALEAVQFQHLLDFAVHSKKLWAGGSITSFVHGNIKANEAVAMAKALEMTFGPQFISNGKPISVPKLIHVLPKQIERSITIRDESANGDEVNTVAELYFQIGNHSVTTLAIADLIEQTMQEPLFDTLRTKQQLGYEVSCTVRVTQGILGFGVKVVSASTPSSAILSSINSFLNDFENTLKTMDQEKFHDHVVAQIHEKQEPDTNLFAKTSRFWTEIHSKRYAFDLNEQLVKWFESQECSLDTITKLYKKWFLSDQARKLTVLIIGKKSSSTLEGNENNTLDAIDSDGINPLKVRLPCYPLRLNIPQV
ncbi:nardilysin [Thraustotheca clavata]|uniref:Nardilysin n=1 Tax=Thraustotheca clavata TaxID=74557 RepID=A0A1W0ABJ9_9STRA|nr:nardilysin [Thraustotheca clavata]